MYRYWINTTFSLLGFKNNVQILSGLTRPAKGTNQFCPTLLICLQQQFLLSFTLPYYTLSLLSGHRAATIIEFQGTVAALVWSYQH